MSRRVQTVQLQSAGGATTPDTYFDKVVKYIPADIVAAWVAVSVLIKDAVDVPTANILWASFAAGVALTAAWTWKQTNVPQQSPAVKQIIISTIAFAVWVFALGAPFDTLEWYRSLYASLVLTGYTLVVGLFD